MLEKGNFINNRYEIINPVGAGGMSDVYKAKDHKLNRNVAIKVLKSEYSKDKNFVSKFRVEAQSAASLIHPNIVNVYDVGEDDGLYYIVMELIEGITLKKYIEKKGKLSFILVSVFNHVITDKFHNFMVSLISKFRQSCMLRILFRRMKAYLKV